jgi:hypothetical protein
MVGMLHNSLLVSAEVQINLRDHDTVQDDVENGPYKHRAEAASK